jgi:FAD/FMN-containing dehydrogenase
MIYQKQYVHYPRTKEEIIQIIEDARKKKERVKVFGSSHSLNGITETDGHFISLDNYNKIIKIDMENSSISVQSGIRIHQINQLIWEKGLSLRTIGAISDQSISGGSLL